MSSMTKIMARSLAWLAFIGAVFGPWIVIWAINTLFAVGIAYTFSTWLAMLILGSLIFGGRFGKKGH